MCGHPVEHFRPLAARQALDDCADETCRRAEAILVDRRPFAALEVLLVHRDGHRCIIEVSGVPVFGADGGFQGLRGISRDVSERKRIEAEQQRLRHQLLHSQKLESIGRLASGWRTISTTC